MNKLTAVLCLLLPLTACGVNDTGTDAPETNAPPTVALATSPQSGPAPLAVTLSATASDPDGDALSYSWTGADLPASATVQTIFETPGEYPVSVTVSDGEESVTASVTISVAGDDPAVPTPPTGPVEPTPPTDPEPVEATLEVTASPGGPIPWGVRYEVETSDLPAGSTLEITCREPTDSQLNAGIEYVVDNRIDNDSFACLYTSDPSAEFYAPDRGYVAVISGGEEITRIELDPDLSGPANRVYFAGTWRYTYTSEGVAEPTVGTFTVTEGGSAGGSSAGREHHIGLYESNDDVGLEYFDSSNTDGTSVGADIVPEPLMNGTQRYVGDFGGDFAGVRREGTMVLEKID